MYIIDDKIWLVSLSKTIISPDVFIYKDIAVCIKLAVWTDLFNKGKKYSLVY